jgi:hypothetical protein
VEKNGRKPGEISLNDIIIFYSYVYGVCCMAQRENEKIELGPVMNARERSK